MVYLITKDSLERVKEHFQKLHTFQQTYQLEVRQIIHGENYYQYPKSAYEEFGYDFSSVDPMRYIYIHGKKPCLESLKMDLLFLRFCYDMPLTILVGTDAAMFKLLPDGYSTVNSSYISRVGKLEDGDKSMILPREKQYLQGNYQLLQQQIQQELGKINLKKAPIWQFKLDSEGFQFNTLKSKL